ncbi:MULTISPECIES: dihydrolipoyl dehydrogenase family protein [unclassified Frankia]|uniref:dihydrolipoyl dehydrogenase family protein n=1 Tax=unclassified Frankia TaxID=2632575 RepID=UPI0020248F8C
MHGTDAHWTDVHETDVIVIGAGPAGENAAGRCADNGLTVSIVERELVGGECSYWGCIPSKTLLRPGDVLAAARRVPGASQAVTGTVDAAAAFAWRDYMTADWNDSGQVPWLDSKKITLFRGAGRLAGARTVEVTGNDGARRLTARRAVVLATGTVAVIPPVDGLRDARPWNNRSATAATHVPRRLLVVGGGATGVEMAQAFHRLGCSRVTIVEAGERLLAREEAFAGEELRAAFQAAGIEVITGVPLASARRRDGGSTVVATLADGARIGAEEILVAVGRRPATADLGLDAVGLPAGRFVDVDGWMRATGVDGGWLYAVGDCNGRTLLTHMGKYQGRLAADVILGRDVPAATDVVPRVIFTDPQVCAVGLTERQARDAGLPIRTVTYSTDDVAGSQVRGRANIAPTGTNGTNGTGESGRAGRTAGAAGAAASAASAASGGASRAAVTRVTTRTSKLVIDSERSVVVGATFIGPDVQELLHAATVAIVGEVPLNRLWHAVPSFPTVSEIWLRLLEIYGL